MLYHLLYQIWEVRASEASRRDGTWSRGGAQCAVKVPNGCWQDRERSYWLPRGLCSCGTKLQERVQLRVVAIQAVYRVEGWQETIGGALRVFPVCNAL